MTIDGKKKPLVISNKKAKLAIIHVAKKSVGIADEDYRALLSGAAGIESAAKLEYEYQFNAIMKAFEALGFKCSHRNSRPQWNDEWSCSPAQRAKIESLWKACARNPTEKALHAFIRRITHADHPHFMRRDGAQKVIVALEAMKRSSEKSTQ